MTSRRFRSVVLAVVLAALVASFVGIEVWRDAVYGEPVSGESVLYVRSGEAVRRLSLGFAPFVADIYWIRAVQYYGSTRLAPDAVRRYDLLYPLLDVTTSLDPFFNIAYRFGSIFLAEAYPGGAGRPDLAIALLEKGFKANPARWHYLQDIGFVYYWWMGDYRQAGEWFSRAAAVPGAPSWLRMLAAVTLAQGGDRQTSRRLWQAMSETADNDWVRNAAALRLAQLDALDAIDRLSAAVAAYRSHTGSFPASWDVLVRARVLRGVPVDPTGQPYVLDPATGRVTLSPGSRLEPLPSGSRAAQPAQPVR